MDKRPLQLPAPSKTRTRKVVLICSLAVAGLIGSIGLIQTVLVKARFSYHPITLKLHVKTLDASSGENIPRVVISLFVLGVQCDLGQTDENGETTLTLVTGSRRKETFLYTREEIQLEGVSFSCERAGYHPLETSAFREESMSFIHFPLLEGAGEARDVHLELRLTPK